MLENDRHKMFKSDDQEPDRLEIDQSSTGNCNSEAIRLLSSLIGDIADGEVKVRRVDLERKVESVFRGLPATMELQAGPTTLEVVYE